MTIKEGEVSIEIPKSETIYDASVFYNPEMEFNRNISVSAVSLLKDSFRNGCDLLSASGIRGLRYIKESGIDCHFNDINKDATKLIKKNLKKNKIKADVTNKDANLLLRESKFGFIDIDPFGSPIHFIDSAVRSLPSKGLLAFTATDTAPLAGTYPKKSLRRYGIKSIKTDYMHELGIRILITAVMKKFFQEGKTFQPVLSYSHIHYFRVFGKVDSGNSKIDRLLDMFSSISHCFECGWRALDLEKKCPVCGSSTQFIDSVYMGPLNDNKFLKSVSKDLSDRGFEKESTFVGELSEESHYLYIDTHYIAGKLKKDVPRIEEMMEKVKKKGYDVSRTHFSPTSLKTDMPFEKFLKLYK